MYTPLSPFPFNVYFFSSTHSKSLHSTLWTPLIDRYELKETGRFRGTMNADDVLAILHHHWVLSDDYYPTERDRLGHAIMNIFCSSTTARGGTFVESSGYCGTNEALEYREYRIIRSPRHRVPWWCQARREDSVATVEGSTEPWESVSSCADVNELFC
jgi:hypothetical protein